MVMSLAGGQYVEPGLYIKVDNVPAPNVAAGAFIPIFVGIGRKEYDVNANITRSALTTRDILTDEYTVVDIISVADTFGNVYTKDYDYKLTLDTAIYYVDWNNPVSITGTETVSFNVNSKTLLVNIDGVSKTVTFSGVDPIVVADIVIAINAEYAPGTPASVDSTKLKLTGNTLAMVTGGTAMDDLGFVKGVNDKAQARRPADGAGYIATYKRLKLSTEYKQRAFSRIEDVYAEHGPRATPSTIDIGSGGTATSWTTNTLTDSVADFTDVELGYYVKITAGTGAGQIRVITGIDTGTYTLSFGEVWTDTIDGTSEYVIQDGPVSEISIACSIAQSMGTVNYITCQSVEDIVDDNNLRLAIDRTKEPVDGLTGWCLVYLKGVDKDDSIVSYIKQYLADMNQPLAKQERMALLGVKASTTTYTDVTKLTAGILNRYIGVVANPYATITGLGTLDGSYIAAGIAGIICNPNYDAGEPISGKALPVFDTINDPYLRHEKRQMGAAGAIVIEKQGVDNKIVHYLSTKTDDIVDSELKVVKQEHDIKKTLRNTLQSALVNIRIVNQGKNIKAMADSFINLILGEKVNLGIISGYRNVTIDLSTTEPRELLIKFEWIPVWDCNWVSVTMSAVIS